MLSRTVLTLALAAGLAPRALAQTSPIWHEEKVKNFLPHMTSPEVRDLLTRTDIVVIPVPSIEQHGPQTPTGTDYYAGVEEAKLRFDRHGGVGETARALYLFPSLVQLDKAQQATLTFAAGSGAHAPRRRAGRSCGHADLPCRGAEAEGHRQAHVSR